MTPSPERITRWRRLVYGGVPPLCLSVTPSQARPVPASATSPSDEDQATIAMALGVPLAWIGGVWLGQPLPGLGLGLLLSAQLVRVAAIAAGRRSSVRLLTALSRHTAIVARHAASLSRLDIAFDRHLAATVFVVPLALGIEAVAALAHALALPFAPLLLIAGVALLLTGASAALRYRVQVVRSARDLFDLDPFIP